MNPSSSDSINRHRPIFPKTLEFGVTPSEERRFGLVLKSLYHNYPLLKSSTQKAPHKTGNVISEEMLTKAECAINALSYSKCLPYLYQRGFGEEVACKYKIRDTSELCKLLGEDYAKNLSLSLPLHFSDKVDSLTIDRGISIPYYEAGKLLGFCTRIYGSQMSYVKYAFSLPSRYTFGYEESDMIYVVEGVFDVIAMHKRGLPAMALGDSQPCYYKLHKMSKVTNINLLFDNDYAGWLGTVRSFIALTKFFDVDHKRINIWLPEEGDPDSCEKINRVNSINDIICLINQSKHNIA